MNRQKIVFGVGGTLLATAAMYKWFNDPDGLGLSKRQRFRTVYDSHETFWIEDKTSPKTAIYQFHLKDNRWGSQYDERALPPRPSDDAD